MLSFGLACHVDKTRFLSRGLGNLDVFPSLSSPSAHLAGSPHRDSWGSYYGPGSVVGTEEATGKGS